VSDQDAAPVRRRIGVFGGTFDPPHIGHLVAARNALALLELDEVLFVVANEPWQKVASRSVSPAVARCDMVAAAIADLDGASVCDVELRRGGMSYTADTLATLARDHPDAELILLVGADAARGMPTWDRLDDVLARCTVAMIDRPEAESAMFEGLDAAIPLWVQARVRIPLLAISSTELRRRVALREPLDYLVPSAVVAVIERLGLYRAANL